MKNKLYKIFCLIISIIIIATLTSCNNISITDTDEDILSVGNNKISLGMALVIILGHRDNVNKTYDNTIWDVEMNDVSFGDYFQDEIKEQIALIFAGSGLAEKKGTKLSTDDEKLVKSAAEYYSAHLSSDDKKILSVSDENIYNIFYSYRIAIQCYKDIVNGINSEVSKDEARVINLMQIKISKEGLSEAEISAKKSKIEEAHTKAASGEDFSSLVSKYNEASECNLIVTRSDLTDIEEEAAFNLNQDEVSKVVETDNAFVVYKCTNAYNETLSISNRQQLIRDKKDKEYLKSLNDYLSNHPLDWNDELWEEICVSDLSYNTSAGFFDVYKMFFPE